MPNTPSTMTIRPAIAEDADALSALLNAIIEIGGTTAIENPLTPAEFRSWFITNPDSLSCAVAVDRGGGLAGFQALQLNRDLPQDWADIATFARVAPKLTGVGTALFEQTRSIADGLGVRFINATIRADNAQGLGYYAKMGFETYAVKQQVPLTNGTPVDRISKRYAL